MRRFFCLFAAAVLLLAASGCQGRENPADKNIDEAARSGELRLPLLTLPYTFNPCAVDEGDSAVVYNLFSRLFRITATGELAGDLVSEWSYPENSKELSMTLRSAGILWHDGQKMTSGDVKFTLESIISQQGVLAEQLACVEGVEVVDDTHFIIKLSRYEPFLPYTLAQGAASILPAHLYEGYDWLTAPAATDPVGSGPFRFAGRVEGESVTLEGFSGYYGGNAKLAKLVFKLYSSVDEAAEAFEAGQLDILDCGMSMQKAAFFSESEGYQLIKLDSAQRISLVFNVSDGVFVNNPTLRRAILNAVDREEAARAAAPLAAAATGFIAPLLAGDSPTVALPARDVARADELLAEKYSKDEADRYVRVTLTVFDAEPYPEIAAVLKRNLAEAGIELSVVQLGFDEWQETVLADGIFEVALSGGSWGPYPEAMIHRLAAGGRLNYGGYNIKEVSDKLYAAYFEGKPGLRASYLSDVQQLLADHLPVIPLVEWYEPVACHSRVQNPPQLSQSLSPYEYVEAQLK